MKTNSIKPSRRRITHFCVLLCVFAICILIFNISNRPRLTFFYLLPSNFSLPRRYAYNLIMPNEPNFQQSGKAVTLDIIRTYNDNQPEKRRKKRTQNNQKMNKNRKKQIKTSQIPPQKQPQKTNLL